ncbi:winged helix-turn-helix domain-containing protein [Pseudoalteromonas phenolica]|uniref:winged helix-turn-helix domain-containing protein n=1 Tax=Pseudoalteromonas phenolica TaxID=161398 RepID=UPI0013EEBBE7|nr:winged helix-turn-helix domain-containing protein [Pseudoalteromonas phenolica]
MFDANVIQVKFANWTLCTRSCSLISDFLTQELTPLSYKILCYFILNPNRIISRDEFVSSVWANHYVDDNAINKAISDLRRLLKATEEAPNLIKTHYKKGYSFTSEVEFIREQHSFSQKDTQEQVISSASNKIELNSIQDETEKQSIEGSSSLELLKNKAKKYKVIKPNLVVSVLSISILLVGLVYWWQQQPQTLHLQSKKLSISDSSVYSFITLSPTNDKLAVSKMNTKSGVDEIFIIDLETHKNTKIISESLDAYPIGWASNSIYYQIINNEQQFCEVWRADYLSNNELYKKEKVLDCESQYILSLVADETSNRVIYTKFGYRNVPSLAALVSRDLTTGEEFQVTSPNLDSFGDRYVTISPKKDKVAFIRSKVGLRQIFVANLDGSMQTLLYETTDNIRRVSWSYDANELSWYVSSSKELMGFELETGKIHKQTISTDSYITSLLNGFDSIYGATRTSDNDIFIYDSQTSSLRKLVDNRASEFMPIAVKDGFYFFQEGEPVRLLSYFGKQISKDDVSISLSSLNSGSYSMKNGLIALSSDRGLHLLNPETNELKDSFVFQHHIVDISWFNHENLILVLQSNDSEQHIWMFNINTEESQKIIHKDAKSVSITKNSHIIYQDFYNKFYIFDPQEGIERLVLSLSDFPFIHWKLYEGDLYYSTGSKLYKYSLDTHQETTLIYSLDEGEEIIADFSILKKDGFYNYIYQIHSFKNNEVVLLDRVE